ncbi:DUF484 family protein [Neisseriaceae bacterium TC5R-5]|nr:DUF484 family protein [Neisseriaceae bacterium TC5R-5]
MQDDEVLAFLEQHPDFLAHHAERLGLNVGHTQQQRGVVSLIERQLLDLKDHNRQLSARLQQLLQHGEANDLIINNIHQLSLALQSCHTAKAICSALEQCFARDFALNRLAIRLCHPASEDLAECYRPQANIIALSKNLATPYCGPYVNDEVLSWFPALPVLQSFAQLALRDQHQQVFGIMVLATDDPQRFTFDNHTHYLTQIGELISSALSRVLTPSTTATTAAHSLS